MGIVEQVLKPQPAPALARDVHDKGHVAQFAHGFCTGLHRILSTIDALGDRDLQVRFKLL